MIADPIAVHVVLEDYLQPFLVDPRNSDSVTDGAVELLVKRFGGMTLPSETALDRALDQAEADAHAAELLHLGAAAVAERTGVHRSTPYRRAARHRQNHPRKAA